MSTENAQSQPQPQPQKNDWYSWSYNRYGWFIRWHRANNAIVSAIVRPNPADGGGTFKFFVTGLEWSTYKAEGIALTLEEAKKEVDERVMKIIREEHENA